MSAPEHSAVLMDLDGTITDSAPGIIRSVQYAMKALDIDPDSIGDLHCFVGPPLEASFRKYCRLDKDDAWRAVELYREYFHDRGIYENHVYPGMASLLRRLEEAHYPLALTTSKPTAYARRILTHFNLADCFVAIVGSYMDGRRTDKGELIAASLALLPPSSREGAVMVGDRLSDIEGAAKAGIQSIGVLWGYGSAGELSDASYLAEQVRDLEIILREREEAVS